MPKSYPPTKGPRGRASLTGTMSVIAALIATEAGILTHSIKAYGLIGGSATDAVRSLTQFKLIEGGKAIWRLLKELSLSYSPGAFSTQGKALIPAAVIQSFSRESWLPPPPPCMEQQQHRISPSSSGLQFEPSSVFP